MIEGRGIENQRKKDRAKEISTERKNENSDGINKVRKTERLE